MKISHIYTYTVLYEKHYISYRIAIEISVRYQTSYWDRVILAAAESISAPRLYSEDLNHGQWYGSVEVLNPFL